MRALQVTAKLLAAQNAAIMKKSSIDSRMSSKGRPLHTVAFYFQDVPLYIFGQSYGGKMGAAAARRFHRGVVDGDVNMNVAGFAMGNSWIHPVDSTINWGPFLYWMV